MKLGRLDQFKAAMHIGECPQLAFLFGAAVDGDRDALRQKIERLKAEAKKDSSEEATLVKAAYFLIDLPGHAIEGLRIGRYLLEHASRVTCEGGAMKRDGLLVIAAAEGAARSHPKEVQEALMRAARRCCWEVREKSILKVLDVAPLVAERNFGFAQQMVRWVEEKTYPKRRSDYYEWCCPHQSLYDKSQKMMERLKAERLLRARPRRIRDLNALGVGPMVGVYQALSQGQAYHEAKPQYLQTRRRTCARPGYRNRASLCGHGFTAGRT